jgi:hypothetical protein
MSDISSTDFSSIDFPILNPTYDQTGYNDDYKTILLELNKQIKSGKFGRETWKTKDNIITVKRACLFIDFLAHDLDFINADFGDSEFGLIMDTFLPVCIFLIDDLNSEPHQITGNKIFSNILKIIPISSLESKNLHKVFLEACKKSARRLNISDPILTKLSYENCFKLATEKSDTQQILDCLCEDLVLDSKNKNVKEQILLGFLKNGENEVIRDIIRTNVIRIFQSVEHCIHLHKNAFLGQVLEILSESLSKEIVRNVVGYRLVKLARDCDNTAIVELIS